jgi:hypothetical protein
LFLFQQNVVYFANLSHLAREIFTFLEKRAKNVNAHSEKFGELGLTAGIQLGMRRLKPRDSRSYAGGSVLLVGSPLPDRSKVMAQTKRGTLLLQVGGWAAG